MNSGFYRQLACVVVLALAWSGAASEEPPPDEPAVFYPPAPNLPRLQYLTKFATAYDVAVRKSRFRDFVFGGEDKEEQAINKPYGVAIHRGAIFAVDTRGSGYVIFDIANGKWRSVTSSGNGVMKKPMNITIDDAGTRYVTDTERNVVLEFDSSDRFVRTFGAPGQFRPMDVAIIGNRLYVTDVENHKVDVLDRLSGETLFSFGEPGTGEGQFVHPTNLDVGPGNTVFVSDTNNFRVQQFTSEGEFVRQIGSSGTGFGQFARPKGVAVDRDGVIYVVDAAFQNVQMFNEDGQILMFFGAPGSGRGDMHLPAAVEVDYDNVEFFQQYSDPNFELQYLVLVTNQFGPNKIAVYGFGHLKD